MKSTGEITLTYNGEVIQIDAGELADKLSAYSENGKNQIKVENFITEILGCEIPDSSLEEISSFKEFYKEKA